MKDILYCLFEAGFVADYIDELLYVIYNATLQTEHRVGLFETHFHGNWNVNFNEMTLELLTTDGDVLGKTTLKISLDHTCTNPPTA